MTMVRYEAMEDAGIPMESLQDTKCGVFMGVMNVDWNRLALWDHHAIQTYTGIIILPLSLSLPPLSLYLPSLQSVECFHERHERHEH